ncbi:MAG: peroxiredoxin [Intestinibacter sp.]|uniref:peroxiredoxin n=1 Tax=Intestinibacter sp. TaxID=1965304 RepID=UPI0025C61232|nr:peroxiredoxin [Intestinibacter sp.]MCI6736839.1 peroxiredoxin [Intestinibacter sp.]
MPCLPNLGSKAPDFTVNTTFGPINLSDYKGRWVVLFSHPGDFTPVCTTEFICFAKYYNEFTSRNTQLIGLSVDSNSSHLAWVYNICKLTGIEIPFPIIDDSSRTISNLYGMISEPVSSTKTVRAVFIIDDKQILRTILYYPMTTGRNIFEILRIIDALQKSDAENVVTPANWLPGNPVIAPPPKTYKDLKKRIKNCDKKYSCLDWYLCFLNEGNKNDMVEYMNCPNQKSFSTSNMVSNKKSNSVKSQRQPYEYISANCPNIQPIVFQYVLGNPENLDPTYLDAAIYAFVQIDENGELYVPSPRYLNQMISLRETKPSLKIIAAIGGWGADGFSDAALTPTSRYNFARNVNEFINDYGLDGIDIDWEYPGSSAAGIKSRPEDRENFTLLLTALRDVLGEDTWISVAGTGDSGYINRSAEIDKIAPIIDYFNLMSYDFTAGETGNAGRKHHANLYESDLSLPGYSVDTMVNNLINAGMPSRKINLGVPFYGRLGATTTKSYDELRENYINKNGYIYKFDNEALAPYLIKDALFSMSFDNDLSIFLKAQYVLQHCLGGIFSWTSTYDQANILGRAMYLSINDPYNFEQELTDIYGSIPTLPE